MSVEKKRKHGDFIASSLACATTNRKQSNDEIGLRAPHAVRVRATKRMEKEDKVSPKIHCGLRSTAGKTNDPVPIDRTREIDPTLPLTFQKASPFLEFRIVIAPEISCRIVTGTFLIKTDPASHLLMESCRNLESSREIYQMQDKRINKSTLTIVPFAYPLRLVTRAETYNDNTRDISIKQRAASR